MENKEAIKDTISDLIMDAAISKAIEEKRDLLRPSIEHFLSGKNVNGEFDIALKKLMKWVENKTIETMGSYSASQNEELREQVKFANTGTGIAIEISSEELAKARIKITQLQSTNEELRKENEELKKSSSVENFKNMTERCNLYHEQVTQLQSTIDEKNKELDYWKQRCEAAEQFLNSCIITYSKVEYYEAWQQSITQNN